VVGFFSGKNPLINDAGYFFLCALQNLDLPLAVRLHLVPAAVVAAHLSFLAGAAFLAVALFAICITPLDSRITFTVNIQHIGN
jgi:hypothetical protein